MRKIEPFPGELERGVVEKPFRTRSGGMGVQHVVQWVLTDEQREWLCRWFPEVENSRLMAASGMTHSTLHRFARKFGLKKSVDGMRGIKKRQSAHIKRLCEANGWYDSLRGKAPSEATMLATKQMWQEIREGKRKHPLHVVKERNPARYKRLMRKKSELRKETISKERRRLDYGLPRQTRLKAVVMYPYTHRQTNHRYHALMRGYILMADCSEEGGERYNIYYDEHTRRTELFERNLEADGFRVKEVK